MPHWSTRFYGRWAVRRASLATWGKHSLPCVVRYFHLMLLPKFVSFVLVPGASLCETEAVFAWVHVWWVVWTGGTRSFWDLEPRAAAYGNDRDCVTVHPHWRFAHGPGCACWGPGTDAVWWAPFLHLLISLAFYVVWVIPKHHEMAVHLLCCRQRAKHFPKGKMGALHS